MARHLIAQGKPVPAHYLPPDILPGYEAWLRDFFDLSTDRQLTQFGAGPIPAASIARHVASWDEDEAEAFRDCIRAMDAAYNDALEDREKQGGLPQKGG